MWEVFRASWHSIRCGARERCYKCSNQISQIEYNVKKYLDEKNINYIQQKDLMIVRTNEHYHLIFIYHNIIYV